MNTSLWHFAILPVQSSRKSARFYRTESHKMIKMFLKFQDIFIRPNEFLPDMSGGQTELREDWTGYIGESNKIILVVSTNVRLILSLYLPLSTNNIHRSNSLKIHWINS